MRCIGLVMDYPYEFSWFYEINEFNTQDESVRPYNYIYIGGFILGVIVSSLIKFKLRSLQISKNQHPYYVI